MSKPLNRLLNHLSKRQRRVLLVWALTPLIAAGIWVQNGSQRDSYGEHLVYSVAIASFIWAWIDWGRWPARRLLGLQSSEDWPSPVRAALWIITGVVLGYVAGTAVGDAYAGHSTWELFDLNPQRFGSVVVSSLLLAAAFTAYFWQQGRAEQLAREATDAQLRLLQSQLDPHLMFNTLAHLRALIPSAPDQAVDMLDRFNDYLRCTLSATQAPTHSLAQEFARLQDYLSLMQVRMGPRLQFELSLPEALAPTVIPSLLLQPLVENAIQHGLEPHIDGGTVRVSAQAHDKVLHLEVSNDGAGCLTPPKPGFGLRSVIERVQSFAGARGQVNIHASAQGMRVTVQLPLTTH